LSPEKVTTSMPASIASRAVDHGQALFAGERHELGGRHRLGEAGHRVVRGMDLHDRRGVGADRGGIVLEMGPVGGADLDQSAVGPRHDVGDAEGAADLDELAARDDDLAAGGQRRQHQQHSGGVVVDCGGGLCAGQPLQPRGDVIVALAAAAAAQVVFQRGRRAHGRDRRFDRLLGQERTAKVGVQHRAREIENAALRGLHQASQPQLAPARAGGLVGHLLSAALGLGPGAQGLDHQRPAGALDQRRQRGPIGHTVDGRRTPRWACCRVGTRHGSFPKTSQPGRLPGSAAWPYWPAAATPMRTSTRMADDERPIISAILVDEMPA
jgi:hypothetical protein